MNCNLEKEIISYCAPTLAGMKCGSLFRYYCKKEQGIKDIRDVNYKLNVKGIYIVPLKWEEEAVLIYVFRCRMLIEMLESENNNNLLKKYGYENSQMGLCIRNLRIRINSSKTFPHEIGLFLGYPVEDVKGFIENKGENCVKCGAWKVYCNPEEKMHFFCKMKRCTEAYMRFFNNGMEISKMTV